MISNKDVNLISALDLTPIKVKLMHKESGEGWSLEKADAMETEYRRFLYLMKAFPNEQTAPLVDVDTFWHYHILDTMKYASDCESAFGYFLHHYPYIGLEGEDGAEVQGQAGERMRELYESTFGEAYLRASDAAGAWCGRAPVEAEGTQTAWCGRAPEAVTADGADTAWCGRAPVKAEGAQTAWCGRAPVKAEVAQTAWCGRAPVKAEGAQTAWCGRAPEAVTAEAAKTAWCGRAPVKLEAAQTAWCGRAPVKVEAAAVQTAWCGRAPALALTA
jgi:hypothetical protein